MEVRIKDNKGYVDADWIIENGIMVVSPKVEKFEPKDGDVVYAGGHYDYVFIYKDVLTAEAYYYVSLSLKSDKIELPDGGHISYVSQLRPATEKEKKLLFDKLKEESLAWDAEKKEVVKFKWKPSYNGEYYFKPRLDMGQFIAHKTKWLNDEADNAYDKKGWIFKTNKECQEFCYKLNQAIEGVKP